MENQIAEIGKIVIPILIGVAGFVYGYLKRIDAKEANGIVDDIREAISPLSDGGHEVTEREKFNILGKIVHALAD